MSPWRGFHQSMNYPTEMSMTYGGAGTLIVKVAKGNGAGAMSFQWYKVEDGKETAVGSATTKNQFDLAAKTYPQASIPSAFPPPATATRR